MKCSRYQGNLSYVNRHDSYKGFYASISRGHRLYYSALDVNTYAIKLMRDRSTENITEEDLIDVILNIFGKVPDKIEFGQNRFTSILLYVDKEYLSWYSAKFKDSDGIYILNGQHRENITHDKVFWLYPTRVHSSVRILAVYDKDYSLMSKELDVFTKYYFVVE